MKVEAAIELAKKLRAEGVRRVEFDGSDVRALEFHAPAPEIEPSEDDEVGGGKGDELDAVTLPYEAALSQLQSGKFKRGAASVEEER